MGSSLNKYIFLAIFLMGTFCLNLLSNQINGYEEKRLVVIVPSYNNAEWYRRNLGSIFSQKYENYHIIYIDDYSTDGTAELVEQFVHEHGQEHRFHLIKNKRRRRPLFNRYQAIHMCDDDEIVLLIDGDDWLVDVHVFEKINRVYEDPNIWLTYAIHLRWPEVRKGWGKSVSKKIIKKNAFRTLPPPIFIDHLRTFYAWLFKLIKVEDLLVREAIESYQGKFYPTNTDAAIMFPLIEMARNNFKFMREHLYVYNRGNPLHTNTVNPILIDKIGKVIRADKKYLPVMGRVKEFLPHYNANADLIIIASDSRKLQKFLDSLQKKNITGIDTIYVLFPRENQALHCSGNKFRYRFAYIRFVDDADKNGLQEILKKTSNQYVAFATDTMKVVQDIDFGECLKRLKQTFAYGFYFHMSDESFIPRLSRESLDDDIGLWMIKDEASEFAYPHNNFMVLHDKQMIIDWLTTVPSDQLDLSTLLPQNINNRSVGLFFKHSKLVRQ